MMKYRLLKQKVIKAAGKGALLVAACAGAFAAASYFSDNFVQQQKDAESALSGNKSLLSTLEGQIAKSGEAELNFIAMMQDRPPESHGFSGSDKDFRELLATLSARFNLQSPKLRGLTAVEKAEKSDKSELANFSHDILIVPSIEFEFKATSDLHVFSFIEELKRRAPGLIRVQSISLKRVADLDEARIASMRSGSVSQPIVEASVKFAWIFLKVKESKDGTTGADKAKP
jgi:hypothetical protein